MSKPKISSPLVTVLDSEPESARLVARALRQALLEARVRAFWRAQDAWRAISSVPRVEPYLIVTDWIGTVPARKSFVARVKASYPRTQIILYSGRAEPEAVVRLQNTEGHIDKYVDKDDGIELLLRLAQTCFTRYKDDPVLSTLRLYLSRCSSPEAPFAVIGNKQYSAVDMYWEIIRGTEIGKMAEQGWQSLLMRAVVETKEG